MRVAVLALALLTSLPAVAQAPRPGAELRFATLGSTGGMQGSAFLPIAPSDVRTRPRDATCPAPRVAIRARGLRGLVRNLEIVLPDVRSPGTLPIGSACDQASVVARLEDGSEVTGEGSVHVRSVDAEGATRYVLDLEWSPRVRGERLPMSGHVVVPPPQTP